MKKIIICLVILILGLRVSALEIVYPKKNFVTINASSTFFVGSVKAGENLKINGKDVSVHQNGGFAYVVPLTAGANQFKIQSFDSEKIKEELDFVINRPQATVRAPVNSELRTYPIIGDFVAAEDGIPLRSVPFDAGITRMSHLPKGTPLFIDGERGDFYRVFLNSFFHGWVAKNNVVETNNDLSLSPPVEITKMEAYEDKNYTFYKFQMSQKVPFIIKEGDNADCALNLYLFNVRFVKQDNPQKDEEPPNQENSASMDKQEVQESDNSEQASPQESIKNQNKLKIFKSPQNISFPEVYINDATLSMKLSIAKLFGYEGYWEEGCFVLKVRKNPSIDEEKPLKKIKVVVDAGHGGSELGAVGCLGEFEKDINLSISKKIQDSLEKRGAEVYLTRTKDVALSLKDRVLFSREKDAYILLSIHANALPDGQNPLANRGTSVYYYHNQARSLADSILISMTEKLGTNNDKIRQGSLALVRPTSSVSVLIEVAYMINPDDCAMLSDKEFQEKCADAIVQGIENYLRSQQ